MKSYSDKHLDKVIWALVRGVNNRKELKLATSLQPKHLLCHGRKFGSILESLSIML